MRAAFLSPIARPALRLKLDVTPAGHQYLAQFAERTNGLKPSAEPFPFASHRTLAEVEAQSGVAAWS
jgi:hypothetical protein